MERRIQETDRRRVSLERAEDAGEVLALIRQELVEGDLTFLDGLKPGMFDLPKGSATAAPGARDKMAARG